jgi:hypothetical protein
MEKLVQLQTEQVLLTYLLSAYVNENNSYPVRSELKKILKDLESFIQQAMKTSGDPVYQGHLMFALDRMKEPEKARPTVHKEIPPGAPIGCEF